MVFGVAVRAVEYNENDDVISETEENGDITSSEYEDEKNPYLPTSETTTNGNDFISQTVYEYDPKGNVISETDKGENKKEEKENKTMVKVTVNVEGMMCGHCEAHVNKAIQAAFGAEDVVSSHENGTTVFTVPEKVDEAKVEEVIKEAGYEFKGITQE